MRAIIWNEMYYAKKNEYFITEYVSFLRLTKKIIELSTALFILTGIISWFSENNDNKIFTGICLFIIGFLQIADIIQNKYIASEEFIDNTRQLKSNWIAYFDNLEKIWNDIDVNKVDESIANNSYQKTKSQKQSIEDMDSNMKFWKLKHINDKANSLTNNFMKRYHE